MTHEITGREKSILGGGQVDQKLCCSTTGSSKGRSKKARINHFAKKVFKNVSGALFYPFRFLGSKTWSIPGLFLRTPKTLLSHSKKSDSLSKRLFGGGYSFKSKKISQSEARPYLLSACAASAISVSPNTMQKDWFDPMGLKIVSPKDLQLDLSTISKNFDIDEKRFFDRKSGLKAMVLEKDDEIMVVFGAAAAIEKEFSGPKDPVWKKLERKMKRRILLGDALGIPPKIFKEAAAWFEKLREHPSLASKKMTVTGHCLGGVLAAYVGIEKQVKAIGYNSKPFGIGLQNQIGAKKLRRASEFVTHISVKDDFYSDCPNISTLDRMINLAGLKTHGNFGRHFTFPAYQGYNLRKDGMTLSYKNQLRIHNFYVGSLMSYLGYHYRDKPSTLVSKGENLL